MTPLTKVNPFYLHEVLLQLLPPRIEDSTLSHIESQSLLHNALMFLKSVQRYLLCVCCYCSLFSDFFLSIKMHSEVL